MEFISSMQFSSHLSTERNHPHKIVSSLNGTTLPSTCNRIPPICCLGLIGKVADGGFKLFSSFACIICYGFFQFYFTLPLTFIHSCLTSRSISFITCHANFKFFSSGFFYRYSTKRDSLEAMDGESILYSIWNFAIFWFVFYVFWFSFVCDSILFVFLNLHLKFVSYVIGGETLICVCFD